MPTGRIRHGSWVAATGTRSVSGDLHGTALPAPAMNPTCAHGCIDVRGRRWLATPSGQRTLFRHENHLKINMMEMARILLHGDLQFIRIKQNMTGC